MPAAILFICGILILGARLTVLNEHVAAAFTNAIGLQGFPSHLLARLTWSAQWGIVAVGIAFIVASVYWKSVRSHLFEAQNPSKNALTATPWVLLLTSFFAFVLVERLAFLDYPLTPDEYAYLYQARLFSGGHMTAPAHPLQEFFKCSFIAEHNGRLFSIMPAGWSFMLAPVILLGIPWVLSPLCTALAVVLTYHVGQSIYSHRTGLVAALLMAISPFVVANSGTYLTHQANLFLFMCFLALFIHLEGGGGKSYQYALLGLIAAIIPIVHELEASMLVPFILILAYRLLKGQVHRRGNLLLSLVVCVTVFVCATGWYHYSLTGSPLKMPFNEYIDDDNYLSTNFVDVPPIGLHAVAMKTRLIWTAKRVLLLNLFLFPLAPLCMFLAPFLKGRNRWDLTLLCSVLCLWVGYMFYNGWGGVQLGPRYYLPSVGVVWLLASESLLRLGSGSGKAARNGLTFFVLLGAIYSIGFSTALLRLLPEAVGYIKKIQDVGSYLEERNIHHSIIFLSPSEQDKKVDIYTIYLRIRNSPDLSDDNLVAVDRGGDNWRLMDHYPGRRYFRYEINMDELVRGEPMKMEELRKRAP